MPKNSRTKKQEDKSLRKELVKQMVTLSTSGFGLVAALAWNNFIQLLVSRYINRWFPNNGGIISLLIYALIITLLAVMVTYELSKLADRVGKE